jgi:adenylyl cyclase-associated protein
MSVRACVPPSAPVSQVVLKVCPPSPAQAALEAVTARLEAVASRLEAAAGGGGGVALATPAGGAPAGSAALAAFEAILAVQLPALTSAASALGGPVEAATSILQRAFEAERPVVAAVAACKQPATAELQQLLAPLGAALSESECCVCRLRSPR